MSSAEMLSLHDQALVEAVARRVVQLLDERAETEPNRTAGLVDATTLAKVLGITRSTVYEHAERLGAINVGDGPRPRLRFDVDQALAAWTRRSVSERSQDARNPAAPPVRRPRRRRQSGIDEHLLPVRGHQAA